MRNLLWSQCFLLLLPGVCLLSCYRQAIMISPFTHSQIFAPGHAFRTLTGVDCMFTCSKLGDSILSAAYDYDSKMCSCLETYVSEDAHVGQEVFFVKLRSKSIII